VPPPPLAGEQGLVQPQRLHRPEPFGVVDQGLAVDDDRIVDGDGMGHHDRIGGLSDGRTDDIGLTRRVSRVGLRVQEQGR
jgi:hypothetical protein